MTSIRTYKFGTLETEEGAAVDFPQGLPGFESSRRFALLAEPELSPVVCLQSLDSPDFRRWSFRKRTPACLVWTRTV
jgi:flagellar assembly factor FliW